MKFFRLTIPMLFGIFGTIAFNLIDAYFIGQLGTRELAAISFTFPIIFILGGISFGLGVGASAVISKAIGENDQQKVARLTTDSLVLAAGIVLHIVANYGAPAVAGIGARLVLKRVLENAT